MQRAQCFVKLGQSPLLMAVIFFCKDISIWAQGSFLATSEKHCSKRELHWILLFPSFQLGGTGGMKGTEASPWRSFPDCNEVSDFEGSGMVSQGESAVLKMPPTPLLPTNLGLPTVGR